MQEEQVVKTKGEQLKEWVLKHYQVGKAFWQPYQDDWKQIKKEYEGIYLPEKEWYQSNIIVPTLKKVVRALCSHYMGILLSKGAESFDIAPGEESDKDNATLLRYKIIYDLTTLEIERKMLPILQNFVLYGYAVGYVPWKHTVEKQRTGKTAIKEVVTFDGPDLQCVDLQKLYTDPNCKDLSSWKIYQKDDVPIHYLKQKEKEDVFFNVDELKQSIYPDSNRENKHEDKVELLEYHGLIPKALLDGKTDSLVEPNPFDDEYVQGIVVLANQEVVIRASEYPYWCNDIFVAFTNDHMIDEIVGKGVGEDIKALAPMLTNLYNKLCDCINIITNPMYEVSKGYLGRGKTILSRPGRMLRVKAIGSIKQIDTTAQAASLSKLQELIGMIDKIIEELTGATPQVMPTGDKKDVHSTATGLQMMTQQSMQPINSKVKFYLEPPMRKILGIIYRHNIQHFKKENAVRILGEKASKFNLTEITRADIMMKGNPDFIPTGISGFLERATEIKSLLEFMKISAGAMVPVMKTNMMTGDQEPVTGEDGKPSMKPVVQLAEVVRRIAELFRFKDIEKLLPEEEKMEKPKPPKQLNPPQTASQSGMAGRSTPTAQSGGYLGAGGGNRGNIKGE